MSEFTVRLVDPEITRELRRSVLRPSLPVGSLQPGEDGAGVRHLAAFAGTAADTGPVSTCLLRPEDCPWLPGRAWRLRGMATEPDWRGRGAATAIIAAASRIAIEAGVELIWCQARQSAIGFYRSQGWQEFGELFDTEYGPHRRMWCELAVEQA